MQLLIILALLLYGGNKGGFNVLSEVKPVLESIGGEQMKEAIKSAEQISEVISAVQEMSAAVAPAKNSLQEIEAETFSRNADGKTVNFPLAPIALIADKDITYSLSRYIAQN